MSNPLILESDIATTFDIRTHNGTITVTSPSGEHRTFKIKTQKPDANFAPGERIVSLLSGPDDYRGVGFLKVIKGEARIILWKKHRTPHMRSLVKVLKFPEHYQAKGCEYLYAGTCRKCNRELTNPVSIATGIGPICASRSHE